MPAFRGHFSVQGSAVGGLSYKVKKEKPPRIHPINSGQFFFFITSACGILYTSQLSHSDSYCRANGTAFPSPLQKICAHRCTEKFSDVIAVSDHTPSVLPLLQRQQRLSRLPAKGFPLQYYECIRQFSCEILYPGPNNLLFFHHQFHFP